GALPRCLSNDQMICSLALRKQCVPHPSNYFLAWHQWLKLFVLIQVLGLWQQWNLQALKLSLEILFYYPLKISLDDKAIILISLNFKIANTFIRINLNLLFI